MKRLMWLVGLIVSLLLVKNAFAVNLEWDANTEPDLLGYNVYWCNPPAVVPCDIISMSQKQDVGNQTTIRLTPVFDVGTIFFVTAYDGSQNESVPSNRVELAQIPPPPPPQPLAGETPPNFKVAFIGDSNDGSGQQAVLDLIKSENVDLVLHQGDFSYSSGPTTSWKNAINSTLGSNFPYLGSDGNHDSWSLYESFFEARLAAMGLASTLNGPNYTRTYRGLKMVFTQEGGNPTHIRNSLAGDTHIWKICSWHKNRRRLNVGLKGNEQSLGDYEECRKAGAIIINGHEHTYHRTKTLSAISDAKLTVDPACSGSNNLCVDPGRTFVAVSGLGGTGIRNQDRCLPKTAPYGCDGEWAVIYTSDQNAKFGALFMTFHVDGDPRRARGIFKNVSGQIIDEFTVQVGAVIPPPPPPPPPPSTGSLANDTTHVADSGNFASNHPVQNLWDGCLNGTPACTSGAGNIASFWVEFDLGQDHDLTQSRLFGDAAGTWWSSSWTLEHKRLIGDAWTTAFANANALVDDWVSQDISGVLARFVRVTVFGNQAVSRTQARELEIYGTVSGGPPPPGPPSAPSGVTVDIVVQ